MSLVSLPNLTRSRRRLGLLCKTNNYLANPATIAVSTSSQTIITSAAAMAPAAAPAADELWEGEIAKNFCEN